jgi:Tol biopolymer transport system component
MESVAPSGSSEQRNFVACTQMTETGPEILGITLFPDAPPNVFLLTDNPGYALRPRWSPDLRHIGYLDYDPDTGAVEFWVIDMLDGASSRPVGEAGLSNVDDFSWSPDGRFLVFHGTQPDKSERGVYRLEVESGGIVNLTADSPVWNSDPAWSPDGELIAFVSDRAEDVKGMDNVWLMAPDGTGLTNLTDSDWEDTKPSWSPDGTQIAFYRWSLYGADERGPTGLWVTNVETGEERLIIELEGMFTGFGFDAPTWSLDGRFIAYQAGLPDEADVYVISAAGGEAVNVSNLPGDDRSVAWSPDSKSLIFTHSDEEGFALYIAAADGTDTRPLLEFGGNDFGDWAPVLQPQD